MAGASLISSIPFYTVKHPGLTPSVKKLFLSRTCGFVFCISGLSKVLCKLALTKTPSTGGINTHLAERFIAEPE